MKLIRSAPSLDHFV
uniref:Uncharacterized protein n=1 Tax=Anguilla anguilla TaxID=7936 RepID=A0A0E9U873_ANGAN